jgi:glutamyl-tRNA synthetase
MPGAEEELINGLHWLGLDFDEGPEIGGPYGPYRQSERKEIYQEYGKQLIDSGHAFYCFCTPERLARVREEQQKRKEPPHYDGTCRNLSPEEVQTRINNGEKYVIRFKAPKEGTTTVKDHLRGEITVENHTLDDTILIKSDGWALYHLAAMVDDHMMKITHVVRGSEWLPSLPLHSLICRAFGWEEPVWIHLSVFLKPSGKGKMSKRESADLIKDGHSIFIKDFAELGYIPEAVDNWVALMGWSYDDHTEYFTLQDLVEKFDLNHLNPSPAAINFTKLDHFNGLHIRSLSDEDLANRIEPYFTEKGYTPDKSTLIKMAPILKERLATLDDSVQLAGFFFEKDIHYLAVELIPKGLDKSQTMKVLQDSYEILNRAAVMDKESDEPLMREYVERSGLSAGQVFGILRIAVTGQKVSPPLFESMEIIGKETVLARIQKAIELLK